MSNKKPRNNKGVSLVEVMIALVILLLVFMALMQTALVSIDANIRNLLRDEAVSIAEQRMTALRNLGFNHADLADTGGVEANIDTVYPRFRNINATSNDVGFTSKKTIDDLNTENKQITVNVTWSWKGDNYSHAIQTVMRMQ